jgi:hypothetical protein
MAIIPLFYGEIRNRSRFLAEWMRMGEDECYEHNKCECKADQPGP